MEPCIANLPLSPDPLSSFPRYRPSVSQYPGLQGLPFPLMSRCNSSTLLTNLGLRYYSSRQGPLGVGLGQEMTSGSCGHTGTNSSRPYRSMENLNWNNVADSGLCAFSAVPYRSMDSEFILRYTATSHWYDGPPDGSALGSHGLVPNPESMAFYPRHGIPRKDLFPHLLFPTGVDELDARKGLREKLRIQSARSAVESLKPHPMRPQMTPGAPYLDGVHQVSSTGSGCRPMGPSRITNPEEIKQEVLRRLKLRRQNSSPNLTLSSSPSTPKAVKTSTTTDNIATTRDGPDSLFEARRPPMGRLHIPTFEEFKRMRQKEGGQKKEATAGSLAWGFENPKSDLLDAQPSECPQIPPHSDQTVPQTQYRELRREPEELEGDQSTVDRTDISDGGLDFNISFEKLPPANTKSTNPVSSSIALRSSTLSPIRTGPSPRLPLQPLGSSNQAKTHTAEGDDVSKRRRRSSLETFGSVPFTQNLERPSSCCPALLLEGTDLSRYGAKIYKMKDGLIGSALDLIKKRSVGMGG